MKKIRVKFNYRNFLINEFGQCDSSVICGSTVSVKTKSDFVRLKFAGFVELNKEKDSDLQYCKIEGVTAFYDDDKDLTHFIDRGVYCVGIIVEPLSVMLVLVDGLPWCVN